MSATTEYPQTKTRLFQGVVKWFNATLGYGFIAVAPVVKQEFGIGMEFDLFFHGKDAHFAFPTKPQPEDRVQFNIVASGKGPRAINVEVAR
jgi:cold shock CspA family protein